MDSSPRLPTKAEKVDLALLLAKRRYPHYPFLTPVEMVRAVAQVFQAAIGVSDGNGLSPKLMFVLWNDDQTQAECLTWFDGELEPAPDWWQVNEPATL